MSATAQLARRKQRRIQMRLTLNKWLQRLQECRDLSSLASVGIAIIDSDESVEMMVINKGGAGGIMMRIRIKMRI